MQARDWARAWPAEMQRGLAFRGSILFPAAVCASARCQARQAARGFFQPDLHS